MATSTQLPKGKLLRIAEYQLGKTGSQGPIGARGPQGIAGPRGEAGRPGIDGKPGQNGLPGPKGRDGRDGKDGTSLKLEDVIEALKNDESFIDKTRGKDAEIPLTWGGGGGHATGSYTHVNTATHTIGKSNLVHGTNVIGVNYAGDVTIYLPTKIDPEMLIVINDESGAASSNNITVTTA